MPEHRRRLDENGNTQHERANDNDNWARLDQWANRFKITWFFWIITLSLAGWIGSRVIQPLNQVAVIATRQQTVIARLDRGDSTRYEIQAILRILVRITCLNLNAKDRAQLALDCREIPLLPFPTLSPQR